jgi:large subunit ribosomal protein L31
MKKDIHPDYKQVIFQDISTEYQVLTRSTMSSEETIEWEDGNTYPLIRVEISSASHPFYTGKRQNIADRGGRIEQFRRRYGGEDSEVPAAEGAQDAEAAAAGPTEEAQQADS